MSKVLAKVIGILALSLGLGSVALSANWTPAAHNGTSWQHHSLAAGTSGSSSGATTTAAAPEIDPAGALSGLTLLLGGLAVIRGSRAKK